MATTRAGEATQVTELLGRVALLEKDRADNETRSSRASYRPKLSEFDKFDGCVGSDVKIWRQTTERIMALQHITSDEDKMLILSCLFTGPAMTWYNQQLEHEGFKNSTDIFDRLSLFRKPLGDEFYHRRNLGSVRQGLYPVTAFFAEFVKKADKVPSLADPERAFIFTEGLAMEIKQKFMDNGGFPSKLQDLVDRALDFESSFIEVKNNYYLARRQHFEELMPPNHHASSSTQRAFAIQEPDPNDVQHHAYAIGPPPGFGGRVQGPRTPQAPRTKLSTDERQYRLDHRLCFYCGSANHVIGNCPTCPTSKRPGSLNPRNPGNGRAQ
jgi:hypothetical protein